MTNAPLLSVIIPVYNAVDYLSACVDSLRAQTLGDWEGILVDDGSTDGSDRLCDALAAVEPRLRVIHQANGGPSAARNAGMAAARGTAYAFLDSDDTFDPTFLQTMWTALATGDADLAVCTIEEHRQDGSSQRMVPAEQPNGAERSAVVGTATYLRDLVYGRVPAAVALTCYNKLYRADLLRAADLWQDKALRRGEDALFNMQFLSVARQICLVPQATYHYRRRAGSLMERYPEMVALAQARQLDALHSAAERVGLLADADFVRHLSQYRMQAFLFAVYQTTGAGLGIKKTAARLGELLRLRLVGPRDVRTARPPGLLRWPLLLAVRLHWGAGLLAWLLLYDRLTRALPPLPADPRRCRLRRFWGLAD